MSDSPPDTSTTSKREKSRDASSIRSLASFSVRVFRMLPCFHMAFPTSYLARSSVEDPSRGLRLRVFRASKIDEESRRLNGASCPL